MRFSNSSRERRSPASRMGSEAWPFRRSECAVAADVAISLFYSRYLSKQGRFPALSALLAFEQPPASHPVLDPIGPSGDEVLAWAQAVAVAALGIDMQLDGDFGLFQSEGVKERGFYTDRIVFGHCDKDRRSIGCRGGLRSNHIILFFRRKVRRVNQDCKIRFRVESV